MMMISNKIEPGCIAIIIFSDSGNEGRIVHPIKYIGNVIGFFGKDYWEDEENDIITTFGRKTNIVQESRMMRIDGFTEENEQIEETLENEY